MIDSRQRKSLTWRGLRDKDVVPESARRRAENQRTRLAEQVPYIAKEDPGRRLQLHQENRRSAALVRDRFSGMHLVNNWRHGGLMVLRPGEQADYTLVTTPDPEGYAMLVTVKSSSNRQLQN
jgi:hypothetical protein